MSPRRSKPRLAALCVSLALLPASAWAQTAPANARTAAPAAAPAPKGPTTIDAERIEGVSGIEVTASGRAEIRRDDMTIFGETLRLNRETGLIQGEGGVRIDRAGDRISGSRLRYNQLDETGVMQDTNFLLRRGETMRGTARELEFLGPDRYRLRQASYTTCAPGHDDWRFEAEEVVLDYETEEARLRNGKLSFFDTTILPVPFGVFPLDKRRKSGFLTPRYSQSSLRGLEVEVPYYWNIAPEQDLTLTPVYMARRGLQLKGEYRYLQQNYSGNAHVEYLGNDRVRDRSRYGLSFQHQQRLAPGLGASLDFNKVSDNNYFEDLGSQVRHVSVRHLPREGLLSHSGAIGDQAYGLTARVQRFQTLQDSLKSVGVPYNRVPQINFGASRADVAGLLDASLPAEYVRFSHPTAIDGTRIVASPTLAAPFLAPGWFFTPKAGLHRASYDLQRAPVGQPGRPDFSVPWASLDGGLVFDRQASWFGRNLTQTLEPRLFYVYAPHRNQNDIPVFDTGLAELNYAQLFTENRFSGGDRFGDANQLTAAVTTRFLTDRGVEALRATLAQRYYFADERVGITPTAPLRTFRDSDVLASVGGRVTDAVSFDTTLQWNPRTEHAERYTISARYSPEIAKVVSASYRFNRNLLRQIDVSGQWPVAAGWYAVGRYNYSFRDSRLIEALAGFEYNGGCWIFRAVMQRVQTSALLTSTAVMFQLEFSGFGQIGTDDVADFLKRRVSGYATTNPSDPALIPPSLAPRLPFQQVF